MVNSDSKCSQEADNFERTAGYVAGYSACKQYIRLVLKNRIGELKASSDYPHNFKGQMVEDFEWVLSLLSDDNVDTNEGEHIDGE